MNNGKRGPFERIALFHFLVPRLLFLVRQSNLGTVHQDLCEHNQPTCDP
jgi:hypothetical protein